MNSTTDSPMKGTTEECMFNFLVQHEGADREKTLARQVISAFTGADRAMPASWMRAIRRGKENGRLPLGPRLIKLRCLLELLGYEVAEFRDLPDPSQQLSWMVSLGIIDIDRLRKDLEYSSTQTVYDMLRLGTMAGISAGRAAAVDALIEEFQDEIAPAQEAWQTWILEVLDGHEHATPPHRSEGGYGSTDSRPSSAPPAPEPTPPPAPAPPPPAPRPTPSKPAAARPPRRMPLPATAPQPMAPPEPPPTVPPSSAGSAFLPGALTSSLALSLQLSRALREQPNAAELKAQVAAQARPSIVPLVRVLLELLEAE